MKTIVWLLSVLISSSHAESFQLAFDNGYVDSFDSQHDLFKREMCSAADQWATVKLKSHEIQSLLQLVDVIDFLNLPDDQVKSKSSEIDPKITVTCSPCAKYQLQIKVGKKSNKVFWDCGCNANSSTPKSVKPLVAKLNEILYERKEVKSLATSDCRFM